MSKPGDTRRRLDAAVAISDEAADSLTGKTNRTNLNQGWSFVCVNDEKVSALNSTLGVVPTLARRQDASVEAIAVLTAMVEELQSQVFRLQAELEATRREQVLVAGRQQFLEWTDRLTERGQDIGRARTSITAKVEHQAEHDMERQHRSALNANLHSVDRVKAGLGNLFGIIKGLEADTSLEQTRGEFSLADTLTEVQQRRAGLHHVEMAVEVEALSGNPAAKASAGKERARSGGNRSRRKRGRPNSSSRSERSSGGGDGSS